MSLTNLTANLKITGTFASTIAAASRQTLRTQDEEQGETLSKSIAYAFGAAAAAGSIDQVFCDARTLAAGASEKLNVSGGAAAGAVELKNPHLETISATDLVGIVIINTGTVAVEIGGDAGDITGLWKADGDGLVIPPGAFFAMGVAADDATKIAVATDEFLQVANTSGSVAATYQILLLLNE